MHKGLIKKVTSTALIGILCLCSVNDFQVSAASSITGNTIVSQKNVSVDMPIQERSTNSITTSASKQKEKKVTMDNSFGSYVVYVSVVGKYTGEKWTGVGATSASVDTDAFFTTYKIKKQSLDATYTSDKIVVSGEVVVAEYMSVGSISLIYVGEQKLKIKNTFYAKNYL